MITVASAWAPRPKDGVTREAAVGALAQYKELFRIQRASAERHGARHVVYGDDDVPGCDVRMRTLNEHFSRAMVEAQLAAVEDWDDQDHLVLVDGDVMIEAPLAPAFDGTFDIGVTSRDLPGDPLNNGVIYLAAGARAAALQVFTEARLACGRAWGEDQLALARALSPVPIGDIYRAEQRRMGGVNFRVGFLPCKRYNMTPRVSGVLGKPCFAVHFKGDRKADMRRYAKEIGLQW